MIVFAAVTLAVLAATGDGRSSGQDKEAVKKEETKQAETKTDVKKAEQKKVEDTKRDEKKAEEKKQDEKKKEEQKAAVRAVIGMIRGGPQPQDEDAIVKQVDQQYAARFRQLYRTELHFMRMVTEPTKSQYEKIAAETESSQKAAIRAFALAMRGTGGDEEPRRPMADAIAKSVKANLSAEQSARYQKEIDQRNAARKRVMVTNIVALMDRHLMLRPEQRDQLAKVLTDNYDDSWQLQVFMYGGMYLPALPDAKIGPVLTEAQRQVWQGAGNRNVRFGAGATLNFVQQADIEDEVWDADPPKKAADGPGPKPASPPQEPDARP
jgi:hypothetical protein